MKKSMRVMSEKPLNAETPVEYLRSWITANQVFFERNQGQIPEEPFPIEEWCLSVEGEIHKPLVLDYEAVCRRPRAIVANTMECSGNSRSLLTRKASGNPWTIGGVGNAIWGGIWLKDLLEECGLKPQARHVAFEGLDKPLGSAGIQFVRSIPLEKAMASTLLAYEMNGEPLPLRHGFPLRSLALGWTGANCIKWLHKITVLSQPHEGFFMDRAYRVFQKGQTPDTGEVVAGLKLKSVITQPLGGETLSADRIVVLGAAYAGEQLVAEVAVSVDGGRTWHPAEFIGPDEPFAWRQWQFIWEAVKPGEYTLMARTTDNSGNHQPMEAGWNVMGYGNNGVREHAVTVHVV
jgi:DMSO/TMAO reductase YedYZ molybdopterin-dependent catalytic subunit